MRILAVDPGSTVGWCLYYDGDVKAWGQLPYQDFCNAVYHGQLASDVIILERFVIDGNTHRKGQEGIHHTLDVIGFIRWWARGHSEVRLIEQSPHERKAASDDVLRQFGWYKEGKHARDAIRHLVMRLTKEKKLRWQRPT